MSALTIDLLTDSDEDVRQLIHALHFGLSAAREAELVSPEFETHLRGWLRIERARMRPELVRFSTRDLLRDSKWFEFWSTLQPDQEVRWTRTRSSTYFVVTGDLTSEPADGSRCPSDNDGPYVELRRHTGKTFWSHIAQVRPVGWIKD